MSGKSIAAHHATAGQRSPRLGRRIAGAGDLAARERDDYYPTPPEGTEALLRVERFDGGVWECACGAGDMARVIASHGYPVEATDLVDRNFGEARVDFLMERSARAPHIVTNPPYKLAPEFVRHACRLTSESWGGAGKVAMLLRLASLEGVGRADLFDRLPFARLWVFRRRLTIKRASIDPNGGGGMISYGWFVWDPAHRGRPTIGWI